ncbi:putative histidine kinase HHK19p, partial [Aureobasidium melanogenum]
MDPRGGRNQSERAPTSRKRGYISQLENEKRISHGRDHRHPELNKHPQLSTCGTCCGKMVRQPVSGVSGCTTNISAQKLAQENASKKAEALEQVRLSQARLLQFTDNAPIGIVIRGSSDAPMYTNNSWFDITGHRKTEASDVDILSVCYPDDLPMILEKRKEIMEQKKAVEFRTRLKKTWSSVDGSFQGQAWVSIIGFPEFSEDGTLSRMMSLWTDISHSQFSEHMQRKRLEEAIEAKKRTEAFIDITSHEIRNPLGATVHCADLLKESLAEMRQLIDTLEKEKGDDNKSQKIKARLEEHLHGGTEAVDTIISCSMHQRKIADDILSLSKLDSNLLQVAPITVRATEMLNNVANIFAVQAERVGVKLQTQLDKSLSELNIDWVVADSGRIGQVLVNLITNAIKFTKPSKNERTVLVRLGASKERPTNLSVTYATTENPEARVQPESTTDATFYLWLPPRPIPNTAGLDLDYSSVRGLLNCKVDRSVLLLKQVSGPGSLFTFLQKRMQNLPTNFGPIWRFARSPIPLFRQQSMEQVLKHLTKLGHKVQVANHGKEALDYLTTTSVWKQDSQGATRTSQDVDVVLMDIEMPVMDGLTCSRRIRELQASGDIVRHIPIIAVSANARTEQTKQAYDAGVDGFIVKPFRIPELTSVITNPHRSSQASNITKRNTNTTTSGRRSTDHGPEGLECSNNFASINTRPLTSVFDLHEDVGNLRATAHWNVSTSILVRVKRVGNELVKVLQNSYQQAAITASQPASAGNPLVLQPIEDPSVISETKRWFASCDEGIIDQCNDGCENDDIVVALRCNIGVASSRMPSTAFIWYAQNLQSRPRW